MKRLIVLLPLLFCLVSCAQVKTSQYYMMDTVMSFELHGENAAAAEREIADKIASLETIFSPTRTDSELFCVNAASGTPVQLSEEFSCLLRVGLDAAKETAGAFDPTLGSAIKLWRKGEVPSNEALQALAVGHEAVTLDGNTVCVPHGLEFDFGAVAKGYASDCAKEILEKHNIPRALLSLGGNVYAKGEKPDGSPWLVGVRDPNGAASDWLGIVKVRDRFLVASGDYERFFEQDGVRYHHILDRTTLFPAKSDLREVVVVCENGTRADILSTALFVGGCENAVKFWQKNKNFDLILVKNNAVFITKGLENSFDLTSDAYRLEVVE